MTWLRDYSMKAASTDRLRDRPNHLALLATGMVGEAGGIAAEVKKQDREGLSYPAYRNRLAEEVGDFLWYFVRFSDSVDGDLIPSLKTTVPTKTAEGAVPQTLALTRAVAMLSDDSGHLAADRAAISLVWQRLLRVAVATGVSLHDAAQANLRKINSRWPTDRIPHPLFDEKSPPEEQIPRTLRIDFVERATDPPTVLLRCGRIGIGSRLTDNIEDADGYRFHDVFHLAYATYLGWSPVTRAMLRCKRQSDQAVDRNQDGARAGIVEEAVSAIVFARAKEMNFYRDSSQVDYDLLKSIQEFVRGYEVEEVPLWQWEEAILSGFQVFDQLRETGGGRVLWDLNARSLTHEAMS